MAGELCGRVGTVRIPVDRLGRRRGLCPAGSVGGEPGDSRSIACWGLRGFKSTCCGDAMVWGSVRSRVVDRGVQHHGGVAMDAARDPVHASSRSNVPRPWPSRREARRGPLGTRLGPEARASTLESSGPKPSRRGSRRGPLRHPAATGGPYFDARTREDCGQADEEASKVLLGTRLLPEGLRPSRRASLKGPLRYIGCHRRPVPRRSKASGPRPSRRERRRGLRIDSGPARTSVAAATPSARQADAGGIAQFRRTQPPAITGLFNDSGNRLPCTQDGNNRPMSGT